MESAAAAISSEQRLMAERFLALHRIGTPFILANCWDMVMARLFARDGFQAIGTSSYALSAILGLQDGQHIDLQNTVDLVRALVKQVPLPVSADIEAGYAETIEGVVESARQVLLAGAVGINIEDSSKRDQGTLHEIAFQCEKIHAIREMAQGAGVHLVINARTDVFLLAAENPIVRLKRGIERGRAYVEAGADCVFVPDMGDLDAIGMKTLVEEIGAPINILAGGTTPPIAELAEIGIARISSGPRALRAALGLYRRIGREMLDQGTFSQLTTEALSYEETNQLLG